MLVFGGGGGGTWMFPKIVVPKYGWFIMESPINPWMIWAKSSHLMDPFFSDFIPREDIVGHVLNYKKGCFFSRFRSLFWDRFGCFMFRYYCSSFLGMIHLFVFDQFFFPRMLVHLPGKKKKVSWNSRLNPRHAFEANYYYIQALSYSPFRCDILYMYK